MKFFPSVVDITKNCTEGVGFLTRVAQYVNSSGNHTPPVEELLVNLLQWEGGIQMEDICDAAHRKGWDFVEATCVSFYYYNNGQC